MGLGDGFFLMAYASVKCHQRKKTGRNRYEQTAAALFGCRHRPRPHQGKSHGRRHNIVGGAALKVCNAVRKNRRVAKARRPLNFFFQANLSSKNLRICSQALAAMHQGHDVKWLASWIRSCPEKRSPGSRYERAGSGDTRRERICRSARRASRQPRRP